MATVEIIEPEGRYARALFNFDETAGWDNFKLAGLVRFSTSDAFGRLGSLAASFPRLYQDLYNGFNDPAQGEVVWRASDVGTIQKLFATVGSFANLAFEWAGDFDFTTTSTRANPGDVGRLARSDINITLVNRPDVVWSGLSGGGQEYLGYPGSVGDIFINIARFAGYPAAGFDEFSEVNQTLMHELLHSLGLSHPFDDSRSVTADFSALVGAGFESLGFVIDSPDDLNREYFTIMSYDDQPSVDPTLLVKNNAYTPMILDVLALQAVYGEGRGTHGADDDTIMAGNAGYRTYFDRGGVDAIDLEIYSGGGYVDLGLPIGGSIHQIGLVVPAEEASGFLDGTSPPQNLRWMIGNIENVLGSEGPDQILDSDSNNALSGRGGDDRFILLRRGDDQIDGGSGQDTVVYRRDEASYQFSVDGSGRLQIRSVFPADQGLDTLSAVEWLEFSDAAKVSVDTLIQRALRPAALAAALTLNEDTVASGQLVSSAPQPSGIVFAKASDPLHGTVSISESGGFTYTPFPHYNGPDHFTFRVGLGPDETPAATVSITVAPVNDPAAGTIEILGRLGQGLTVGLSSSVNDVEGVPADPENFQYRWLSGMGAAAIEVGTTPTLALTPAMSGKPLSVQVSFTDLSGHPEMLSSAVSAPVAAAALSGTVLSWSGARPVSGVEVSMQSTTNAQANLRFTTSDASGHWAFDGLDFDRFALSAVKAATVEDGAAVSAADVLAALKIAHGRNPNPDPDGLGAERAAPVSPYQLHSADIDHDGEVDRDDARFILHSALTPAFEAPRSPKWLFFDSSDTPAEVQSPVTASTPTSVSADVFTNVQWIGVLLGDVDGNWMRA